MFQSHLVNDENLVVLLGHLLPTVGDVAAAMLGVDLNTTKCKRLSETTRYFYIRDKVVCIISRHVQAIENVVVLYVNVNIPCPLQRSPRVWPGQCREDHWSHCTRPGQLQWGCDLGAGRGFILGPNTPALFLPLEASTQARSQFRGATRI